MYLKIDNIDYKTYIWWISLKIIFKFKMIDNVLPGLYNKINFNIICCRVQFC